MSFPLQPKDQSPSPLHMPSAYPSDDSNKAPDVPHSPTATTKPKTQDGSEAATTSAQQATLKQPLALEQRTISYPNADFDSSEDESAHRSVRRQKGKTFSRPFAASNIQKYTEEIKARLCDQPPKDEEVARAMGMTVEELLASDSEDDH